MSAKPQAAGTRLPSFYSFTPVIAGIIASTVKHLEAFWLRATIGTTWCLNVTINKGDVILLLCTPWGGNRSWYSNFVVCLEVKTAFENLLVVSVTIALSPPDVDARSRCRRADSILNVDVHHQLKGRHTLQLREGAHRCHLLIHSEASQTHDHYFYYYCYYYYFYPNQTWTVFFKTHHE